MKSMDVLTAAFRAFGTAKELANAGGISPITAYRYQNAMTTPDLRVVTRLMGKSREIRDAVLRMAGCDDVSLELETARLTKLLADLQERRAMAYADLDAAKAADRGSDGKDIRLVHAEAHARAVLK